MAPDCACGKENDIDHTLICKLGGFVHLRHDNIRDIEAELLSCVCKDVLKEPPLIPLSGEQFSKSSVNTKDDARADISALSFWRPLEKVYLDVRIFHPNAASYKNLPIESIYRRHEEEKKGSYNERIINVERETFTPLVFSTTGGMAPECHKYHKRLAGLIAACRLVGCNPL